MRVLPILCALAAGACSRAAGEDPFTLARNLRTRSVVELAVAPGAAREALASSLARLERAGRWRVRPVEPSELAGDASRPRILIADPATPGLAPLLEALRRTAEAADVSEPLGPALAERARRERGFALLATFADPARPGLPVTLALAHTAELAARVLGDVTPCAEPTWQVFADGELLRAGYLWRPPRGSPPPAVETESLRASERAGARTVARERFDLLADAPIGDVRIEDVLARWERALAQLDLNLLVEGEAARAHPTVFAHATVDTMLALAGRGELAVANPVRPTLHVLAAPGIPDDGGAALASLVAREALGPARARWLARAVGVDVASTWYGQRLGRWLAHLARARLVPPIAELVDEHSELSPLVLVPARAGLVRYLLARGGRDELRALWTGERELVVDAQLEDGFRLWLANASKPFDGELDRFRELRSVVTRKRATRRGVDLVAPPFDPRARAVGFGSATSLLSLKAAATLGANAAALVFQVYADPGLPAQAGGGARPRLADASDLELFVGAQRAKELGLHVMFRPRLLASPTSSLAGWSLVIAPGGWDAFFEAQERVALHYALLAELAGAELFCFAGEISTASVTKPTEFNVWEREQLAGRAERWRALIERLRPAFSGGLTFAAESLYEAESIQFWGLCDFIGIDLMPEIVRDGLGEEFSRERMVRGMQGLLRECADLADFHRRPVIVTEIGFSATSAGWKLAALPQGEYDGDMQARLYDAWGEALERTPPRRRPQGGAYLWSWSTDPGAGGEHDRGYTPQAKPAERALRGVFGRP